MAADSVEVVFGGGPLGLAVVETLVARGRPVRLVTRSGRADLSGAVQTVAADVSDPEQASAAARHASTIYHCVGANYGQWQRLLPPIMAVVIGAAFGAVVQALVQDLITPLIGAFGGVPDFSALFFTINNSKFLIGHFINALLSFVGIAAVVTISSSFRWAGSWHTSHPKHLRRHGCVNARTA